MRSCENLYAQIVWDYGTSGALELLVSLAMGDFLSELYLAAMAVFLYIVFRDTLFLVLARTIFNEAPGS